MINDVLLGKNCNFFVEYVRLWIMMLVLAALIWLLLILVVLKLKDVLFKAVQDFNNFGNDLNSINDSNEFSKALFEKLTLSTEKIGNWFLFNTNLIRLNNKYEDMTTVFHT